jgi:hypothetical protein
MAPLWNGVEQRRRPAVFGTSRSGRGVCLCYCSFGPLPVFCLVSRCSIVKDSPCVAIDRGSNRVSEVFRDAYMSSPFSLCTLQWWNGDSWNHRLLVPCMYFWPHCAVENSSLFCDVVSFFSCLLLHVKSAGDMYRTVLHKSPALDLTSNNFFCGCVESKKVLKCSHRSVF